MRGGIHWLESIRYTDFTPEGVIEDCFFIGLSTDGAIGLKDLYEMTVKTYLYATRRAVEVCKSLGLLKDK